MQLSCSMSTQLIDCSVTVELFLSCNILKDASVVHTVHTSLNKHDTHSRDCKMQVCCFDTHNLSREILLRTQHHERGKIIQEIWQVISCGYGQKTVSFRNFNCFHGCSMELKYIRILLGKHPAGFCTPLSHSCKKERI